MQKESVPLPRGCNVTYCIMPLNYHNSFVANTRKHNNMYIITYKIYITYVSKKKVLGAPRLLPVLTKILPWSGCTCIIAFNQLASNVGIY